MSVIITAKIPKKLKEELKRYSINISKVVREALEREVMRKKIEEIKKLQEEIKKHREKLDTSFVLEALREIRNEE